MAVTDKELPPASVGKRKEIIKKLFGEDTTLVKEIPTIPEVPPEIERAQPVHGASAQLTKPVTDDQTGQVLVTSPWAQATSVVLPLTEEEIEKGLTYKLVYSIRWLAEFCARIIKKAGGKITTKRKKE